MSGCKNWMSKFIFDFSFSEISVSLFFYNPLYATGGMSSSPGNRVIPGSPVAFFFSVIEDELGDYKWTNPKNSY